MGNFFFYSEPDRPWKQTAGPKQSICSNHEMLFREYLDQCWEIGIPRSEKKFAADIQDFVLRKNVDAPYKDKAPGIFPLLLLIIERV